VQVGDLVRALIVTGQPTGIVTKIDKSIRWGALYHVWTEKETGASPLCFREHQLEVISGKK
tara:strand:+ start:694 stop:876 length:183 start_codon:yes stop_codon:yes gene_type:complete